MKADGKGKHMHRKRQGRGMYERRNFVSCWFLLGDRLLCKYRRVQHRLGEPGDEVGRSGHHAAPTRLPELKPTFLFFFIRVQLFGRSVCASSVLFLMRDSELWCSCLSSFGDQNLCWIFNFDRDSVMWFVFLVSFCKHLMWICFLFTWVVWVYFT